MCAPVLREIQSVSFYPCFSPSSLLIPVANTHMFVWIQNTGPVPDFCVASSLLWRHEEYFFPVAAQREACPGFKNWARKALRASDESLRSRHRRELARRWEGDIGNPRVSEPKLGLMAGAVSMARGRVWRALCAVLTRLPSRIDWNSWGALRTWRSPSLFLLALMSPIVLPDQRD